MELERIHDERTEALGELASKHEHISHALRKDSDKRAAFLQVIDQALIGQVHIDVVKLECVNNFSCCCMCTDMPVRAMKGLSDIT